MVPVSRKEWEAIAIPRPLPSPLADLPIPSWLPCRTCDLLGFPAVSDCCRRLSGRFYIHANLCSRACAIKETRTEIYVAPLSGIYLRTGILLLLRNWRSVGWIPFEHAPRFNSTINKGNDNVDVQSVLEGIISRNEIWFWAETIQNPLLYRVWVDISSYHRNSHVESRSIFLNCQEENEKKLKYSLESKELKNLKKFWNTCWSLYIDVQSVLGGIISRNEIWLWAETIQRVKNPILDNINNVPNDDWRYIFQLGEFSIVTGGRFLVKQVFWLGEYINPPRVTSIYNRD